MIEQYSPKFEFKPSLDFKKENIIQKKIHVTDCFILMNVFTKDECKQIIEHGEKFGFLNIKGTFNPKYRSNERIINLNTKFKEIIWTRISDYIEDTIIDDIKNNSFENIKWKKMGLCKKNKVMKNCILYLNESFDGGETIFYMSTKNIAIKPKTGMCLIFNPKILHEKANVINGFKYFIGCEIYYKKIIEEELIKLTDREKHAFGIYKTGVNLEISGNTSEALKLYIHATKICPNITDIYLLLS